MFLNESIENDFGVSNETSMYEAILEANSAYHTLCMKMVKCEHSAIVSEDTQLLAEAEEKFFDKVKRIAKTLYEKFISFLNRIRAEWSKLVASVVSKFVNTEKVKEMLSNVKKGDIKVKINASLEAVKVVVTEFESYKGSGWEKTAEYYGRNMEKGIGTSKADALNKNIKKAKVVTNITVNEVQTAIKFLEKRKDWIKGLENFRKEGERAYRNSLQGEQKADELAIAKYSSAINKLISRVNWVTIDAVKICRAASKNEDVKKAQPKNESVLDIFNW